MALQTVGGSGLLYPTFEFAGTPNLSSVSVGPIDATGEKIAFVGRVWFPARTGTKDISRVCFRFGNVTKAGGSGLTVSLQDVSLTAGPPGQPDGTQDQTVAIANGDANFVSNNWYRTGALSANRTVTYGDRLAVVIEYDGSGMLGADSVVLSCAAWSSTVSRTAESFPLLYTASWAAQALISNLLLEMSDGTFGLLDAGSFVASAINSHAFNLDTAVADEYAAVVNFPFRCKVDGLWVSATLNQPCEIILYDGVTALATVSVDPETISGAGVIPHIVPITPQILEANTDYYVAIRPTTTSNVTAYSFDVADANHFSVHPGGTACTYTTRLDQGAWAAPTATRRLLAGVRISALDDGAGGGGSGGLLTHPGMSGGLRG